MVRQRFVRGSKSNRVPTWLFANVAQTAIAANSAVLLGSLNAAGLALRPFTVIRSHLWFHMESDQVAASEESHGALGLIVANDQAVAAGANSIPAPASNADAPFFVYQAFINSFIRLDATGVIEPAGTNVQIDSKAMRKVGANEDIAIMIENDDATTGFLASIQGRILVKLH